MNVLVTGHNGYIASALVPLLHAFGYRVVGLDNYLFEGCVFGPAVTDIPAYRLDVRDVEIEHLQGFDAVIHLAGLCNDPLGYLNPTCTYEINHRAAVRLATLAKAAGVRRFLFSSSCSNYGASDGELLSEDAPFSPVTPYGISKVRAERDLARIGDDDFSVVSLRNATAYGPSPKLRGDLVVNNLVGYAVTTGEVLLKSDGTAWRPLVHIADIARAFVAVLQAPTAPFHHQVFNVGSTAENYRVRDVAELVRDLIPGTSVRYATDSHRDVRSYRVDCSRIEALRGYGPVGTVRDGILELHQAYVMNRLTPAAFLGPRYSRVQHVRRLQAMGRLDANLRWVGEPAYR